MSSGRLAILLSVHSVPERAGHCTGFLGPGVRRSVGTPPDLGLSPLLCWGFASEAGAKAQVTGSGCPRVGAAVLAGVPPSVSRDVGRAGLGLPGPLIDRRNAPQPDHSQLSFPTCRWRHLGGVKGLLLRQPSRCLPCRSGGGFLREYC